MLDQLRAICGGKAEVRGGKVFFKDGKISSIDRKTTSRLSGSFASFYNIGSKLYNMKRSLSEKKKYFSKPKQWWIAELNPFVDSQFFKMEMDKADDFIKALKVIFTTGKSTGVHWKKGLIYNLERDCRTEDYNVGEIWHRARNYLQKNKTKKFYGKTLEWYKTKMKDMAIFIEEENEQEQKRRSSRLSR